MITSKIESLAMVSLVDRFFKKCARVKLKWYFLKKNKAIIELYKCLKGIKLHIPIHTRAKFNENPFDE